jgi:hypothetical protein
MHTAPVGWLVLMLQTARNFANATMQLPSYVMLISMTSRCAASASAGSVVKLHAAEWPLRVCMLVTMP